LLLPLCALLASLICVGYWQYYMKLPGYWVRESVGVLFVMLLLQPTKRTLRWLPLVSAAILYPLIGWYSVLSLSLLALRFLLRRDWLFASLSVLAVVFIPAIIAHYYTTIRWQDAWLAHFPSVSYLTSSASMITGAFILLVLSLALLCLLSHFQPQRFGKLGAVLGMTIALTGTVAANQSNQNFHAEMRMYRAIQEFRFDDVLQEMNKASEGPTRQMVCCKNIALLHTGRLATDIFKYENNGPKPAVSDSLQLHMAQTASPLIYLFHGMTNDATHWAVENSVEYGLSIGALQVLALAGIVSGESNLARKYLDMLNLVPFQSEFVKRFYPLVFNPEWIDKIPPLALMRQLHDSMNYVTFNDDGLAEFRIYKFFAQNIPFKNPKACELAVVYSMMLKDYTCFWQHLYSYANLLKGQDMPIPVQEAAYLGSQMDPENYPASGFRFSPVVVENFKHHSLQTKAKNDHTYWWFYKFCNDALTY